MSFTETQLKAMAITPKCTSGLSIPGSFFIIYETFCDYRNGKTKNVTAMQRAVVGMSCVDILSSVGWFLSTWAAPEGWALYAVGNDKTCRFQGFLLQIAIGAPMYNGALILYYLLVIKHKYTHEQILHIEPYLHVFIWIWCIGTSIVLLSLDLIDFIGPVCWVSDQPSCFEETPEPGARCNSKYYSTAFFCVPLWIVICMTIYGLFSIYWEVSGNIKRMSRYSSGGRQTSSLPRSSRDANTVAFRAVAYSVAFIVTWTASTIWSVAQWFDYYPFWVSYTWTLCEPLQGFWNFLIFISNRPSSKRKIKIAIRALTCGLLYSSATPETATDSGTNSSSGQGGTRELSAGAESENPIAADDAA